MSTFILPFDHRSAFAKEILHTSYPFSPTDRAQVQVLKGVIYDGFLDVFHTYKRGDVLGILCDEETGAAVLHRAEAQGIMTALTLEASGEPQLRLQYGQQNAARLRALRASVGKVLLRFSSLPTETDPQILTLAQLAQDLKKAGQRYLVEILTPGEEQDRAAFLVHTIGIMQEQGIFPAYWKLEALPTTESWEEVRAKVHPSSGILMLGRGEDKERVIASLKIAAQSGKDTVVHGFAIGRTLFAQELRDAHEGKITKAQASQRIAENFREMIDIWNNV